MGWTNISSGRYDADSPVDEDLIGDIVSNTEYNHDHALRGGTHSTGVRLAVAMGVKTITFGASSYDASSTVTFSSDSDHGDPNFSSSPRVFLSFTTSSASFSTGANNVNFTVGTSTITSTSFDIDLHRNSTSPGTQNVDVAWLAIGQVTAGE